MRAPDPPSRQQLIAGAADMIRRRGLNATSIREVARHARTPLGSTYHYFPGGKQQLAAEAVHFAGAVVTEILSGTLAAGPVQGLRAFLELWRELLAANDFRAGCPVVAVCVEETADGDVALAAAAEVFRGWEGQLAEALREHGAGEAAGRLATLVVAAVEGAVLMCRARRDTEPLELVAAQLEQLLAAAVTPGKHLDGGY